MRPFLPTTLAAALCTAALFPALAAADEPAARPVVRRVEPVTVVTRPGGRGAVVLDRGKHGYLGVEVLDLNAELRRHFQADEKTGVLVSRIDAGSPGEHAGLAVGDVLVAVDGKPIDSYWDLRSAIGPHRDGESVTLDVVREGRRQQLRATLEEREGRVLELGKLLRSEDGDATMLVMPSGKDWERFGEEMGRMGKDMGHMGEEIGDAVGRAFADPHLRLRIEERLHDREELERRIDQLERRLRELEKRLGDQQRR